MRASSTGGKVHTYARALDAGTLPTPHEQRVFALSLWDFPTAHGDNALLLPGLELRACLSSGLGRIRAGCERLADMVGLDVRHNHTHALSRCERSTRGASPAKREKHTVCIRGVEHFSLQRGACSLIAHSVS